MRDYSITLTVTVELTFCFLWFPFPGYSDVISIPNQYPTINTAVNAAKSGDEIHISTYVLAWQPMVIENKEIIIKGDVPNYLPHFQGGADYPKYMLILRNAHVMLEYLNMDGLYQTLTPMRICSPIYVESGSLTMRHCSFTGVIWTSGDCILEHSILRGNVFESYYSATTSYEGTSNQPAIIIGPGNNTVFRMTDSELACNWQYGFHAIQIQGINQGTVEIKRSRIIGGMYYNSSHPGGVDSPVNGSAGLQIMDCTNLQLDLSDSTFIGGNGYSAGPNITWGPADIIRAAGMGGDGLKILNSSVQLQGGSYTGGSGGAGFVWTMYELPDRIQKGGTGGYGISVYNSQVQWKDVTAKGGPGGPGNNTTPGEDGKPFYIDDKSTWMEMTPVRGWKNY